MRICIISPEIYPYTAGTGNVLFDLSRELSKKHKITIIAPNHTKSALVEKKGNLKIVRINYNKNKLLAKIQFVIRSLNYIRRNLRNTDIFFGNQLVPEGLIAVIAAKLLGKKVVIEAHGRDADVYTTKPMLSNLIYKIVKTSNILLVLNEKHNKQFNNTAKEIIKVKNCVNEVKLPTKTYLKKKYNFKKFAVVFAGNICKNKGLIYAIKGVEKLNFCNLYILGRDRANTGYETKMKRYVKQNKIKNIFFRGELPRNATMECIKAADVFILPTFRESFGVVLVEAMLNNTPIITTNVDDIQKTTGNFAHYIKLKNNEQITENIKQIYTHPKSAKELAKKARGYAIKHYSVKVVAREFQQIFEKLNENR
jgi:glycosyltransferase involved in cell wall biosynthesis